jgi:O-antigen/teichoic acid export membrane protein
VTIVTLFVAARIFDSLLFMFCSFFRGRQEMRYEAALRLSLNAISLGLGLPVLVLSRSLLVFSAFQCAASALVMFAACGVVIRRYATAPWGSIDWNASVSLFKEGLHFSLYGILLVVFLQTNTILLSFFKGDQATGLYTAGYRFVSALGMAATSVPGAVYPSIASLALPRDEELLRETYLRCLRYLWIVAVFCVLGLLFFAPELVNLIYGTRFLPASLGLRIMSFTVLFSYANAATTSVLFSLNMEKDVLRAMAVSTAFVVIINLILLPPLADIGASLTTVLPEVVCFILLLSPMRRNFRSTGTLSLAGRFVTVAAVAGATEALIFHRPLWVRLTAFASIYGGALFATGLIGPQEIDWLLRKSATTSVEALNA